MDIYDIEFVDQSEHEEVQSINNDGKSHEGNEIEYNRYSDSKSDDDNSISSGSSLSYVNSVVSQNSLHKSSVPLIFDFDNKKSRVHRDRYDPQRCLVCNTDIDLSCDNDLNTRITPRLDDDVSIQSDKSCSFDQEKDICGVVNQKVDSGTTDSIWI